MNKFLEKIDDHHNRLRLVMNSDTEYQEWLRSVPNPTPATHGQRFEWTKYGNANCLDIFPAPHPMDLVASVTNHFADLDESRLTWLCAREQIAQEQIDAHIETAAKETPPRKLTQKQTMVALLQAKVPMPKGKVAVSGAATQVREKVIILSEDLARADAKTCEKRAAMANGLNAFKAAQNKNASIAHLRALVAQLEDRKRETEQKARQGGGTAGVLQRA